MNPRVFVGLSVVFLSCSSHLARSEHCKGPGDANFDNHVGLGDFALLDSCTFGPTITEPTDACDPDSFATADLDGDGDVDLKDIAAFALNYGADYFDYGLDRDDKEAELLAMELSGELRAPDQLYDRIHRDLALIRTQFPDTAMIQHRGLYDPTGLIVRHDARLTSGTIEPINRFFLASITWSSTISPGLHILTFCDALNMMEVIESYLQVDGVLYAELGLYLYPDGGTSGRILAEFLDDSMRYTLLGSIFVSTNCLRGVTWVVDVSESGEVELVSFMEPGPCP